MSNNYQKYFLFSVVVTAILVAVLVVVSVITPKKVVAPTDNSPRPTSTPDNANYLKYENKEFGFGFSYPKQYVKNDNTGYQYVTNNSLARIDLPQSELAGTNLGEASFIVGASRDKGIIVQCLIPAPEESATTSKKTINGTEMTVFNGQGVGAGNIYDTTSYRAVVNGICYEATLLRHSGRIENYPPGVVKEFDHAKILAELESVMSTFAISAGTQAAGDQGQHKCSASQKKADVCPEYYHAVCGWFDTNIKCFKYPCAQNFPNECFACANGNVIYWTDGECPK